jgi:hypothetical protein
MGGRRVHAADGDRAANHSSAHHHPSATTAARPRNTAADDPASAPGHDSRTDADKPASHQPASNGTGSAAEPDAEHYQQPGRCAGQELGRRLTDTYHAGTRGCFLLRRWGGQSQYDDDSCCQRSIVDHIHDGSSERSIDDHDNRSEGDRFGNQLGKRQRLELDVGFL